MPSSTQKKTIQHALLHAVAIAIINHFPIMKYEM